MPTRRTAPRTALAHRTIEALLGAADATRRHLGRTVEAHGLTLQHYNVLRILRGAHPEPLPTMEIVDRMLERTPGVTRFLDHLEGRGLVGRERSADDRRRVDIRINEAGLALLGKMDAEVDRADRSVLDGLTKTEAERLVGALERVRENAERR